MRGPCRAKKRLRKSIREHKNIKISRGTLMEVSCFQDGFQGKLKWDFERDIKLKVGGSMTYRALKI